MAPEQVFTTDDTYLFERRPQNSLYSFVIGLYVKRLSMYLVWTFVSTVYVLSVNFYNDKADRLMNTGEIGSRLRNVSSVYKLQYFRFIYLDSWML